MTSGRRSKALREAGLDRRSTAVRKADADPNTRRAPKRSRDVRRAKGFFGAQPADAVTLTPHPLAGKGTRPTSHTNFIRRAAKRNAEPRWTRAQMLAWLRTTDPTASRSEVSGVKRRAWERSFTPGGLASSE